MKKTVTTLFFLFLCFGLYSKGKVVALKNIRYFSYDNYTRVVLDLTRDTMIKEKVLPGPDSYRLYFDLPNCVFHSDFPVKERNEISFNNNHLLKIRSGRRLDGSLRIVMEFSHIDKYNFFALRSPNRLVFDIYGKKHSQPESPESEVKTKKPVLKPVKDSNISLIRQLGLDVKRIVIDPGHGGKDPGAINRRLGLSEKDLTLDIARRLKKILKKKSPDLEVILTRSKDKYLALEERTAIANSKKADLFVSIHVNAAPRKTARGIETYFLSMTTDPWAIEVAAKENAMSRKSIAEMSKIVDRIVKNSKIKESGIFASSIQNKLVFSMKKSGYKEVDDLGVKKAPFYVLVGSSMPSVLVEVSFLSNYNEGKRLKTRRYRQSIASGIYEGIMKYVKSFKKKETISPGKAS